MYVNWVHSGWNSIYICTESVSVEKEKKRMEKKVGIILRQELACMNHRKQVIFDDSTGSRFCYSIHPKNPLSSFILESM